MRMPASDAGRRIDGPSSSSMRRAHGGSRAMPASAIMRTAGCSSGLATGMFISGAVPTTPVWMRRTRSISVMASARLP